MTWLVAAVAVETGIAPSELMADEYMLGAIVSYMGWRNEQQRKAAKKRG